MPAADPSKSPKSRTPSEPLAAPPVSPLVRRHLVFGWWGLAVFATAGIVLEAMHGFKIGWYLDVDHETRRLLLRLAHAHGTLLSVVQLLFAGTLARFESLPRASLASSCLLGALVAMPLGFLLGGLWHYGGDPGVGIFAVPLGALLALIAFVSTAVAVTRVTQSDAGPAR